MKVCMLGMYEGERWKEEEGGSRHGNSEKCVYTGSKMRGHMSWKHPSTGMQALSLNIDQATVTVLRRACSVYVILRKRIEDLNLFFPTAFF